MSKHNRSNTNLIRKTKRHITKMKTIIIKLISNLMFKNSLYWIWTKVYQKEKWVFILPLCIPVTLHAKWFFRTMTTEGFGWIWHRWVDLSHSFCGCHCQNFPERPVGKMKKNVTFQSNKCYICSKFHFIPTSFHLCHSIIL